MRSLVLRSESSTDTNAPASTLSLRACGRLEGLGIESCIMVPGSGCAFNVSFFDNATTAINKLLPSYVVCPACGLTS